MDKYLCNDLMTLRALEPEDIDLLYLWENDPEVWEVSQTLVPFSRYILQLYLQNADKDIYETKQLRLMIALPDGKAVGAIDLFDFDPFNSRAGIGILINSEERSKGYASGALGLLINYCFKRLNIHQLYVNIGNMNSNSLTLFKKYGFAICGHKKSWNRSTAGWDDELTLQLINDDSSDLIVTEE